MQELSVEEGFFALVAPIVPGDRFNRCELNTTLALGQVFYSSWAFFHRTFYFDYEGESIE